MKQINPNLTDDQKHVLFEKGTEYPFSGKLYYNNKDGKYTCVNCGSLLFNSNSKYTTTNPGLAGWPSFSELADAGSVELKDDNEFGMRRTEVTCKKCGVHLGHVFDDDESPTGKHFCINACSLDFKEKK